MNSSRTRGMRWLKQSLLSVRFCHFRKSKEVFLIGVPFSGGQPRKGVEEGPARLRKQGLVEKIKQLGYNVLDGGELTIPTTEAQDKWQDILVKNSLQCGAVAGKLARTIAKAQREEKICLTVGGDHSIAVGSVFGHASVMKKMGLLWVDAHTDINTPSSTTTGNLHGMPLSFLITGIPESHVLPGYEWCSPCLSPEDVAYIGLRDVETQERELCEKLGIASYTIDDIDKDGIGVIINKALERINPELTDIDAIIHPGQKVLAFNRQAATIQPILRNVLVLNCGDRPIHVSYDIDSLDPQEAPSTGTPVRGGLTLDEGIYVAQIVAQSGCLCGIDIVEFNPAIGSEEDVIKTAKNTMTIIEILLGKKSHLNNAPLPPVDVKADANG